MWRARITEFDLACCGRTCRSCWYLEQQVSKATLRYCCWLHLRAVELVILGTCGYVSFVWQQTPRPAASRLLANCTKLAQQNSAA